MHRFILPALMAAAFATGCLGTVRYTASVETPDLVYAAPGVQVIADYDEPIFYSDSFYWRWDGSTWYRSSNYRGGWIHAAPPRAVIQIREPRGYVHYRPHGWIARGQRPAVNDHRNDRHVAPQPQRARPAPARPAPKEQPRDRDHHDDDDKHDKH